MRCQDCPYSCFTHDWRETRCLMTDSDIFEEFDEQHELARAMYEDEEPDWCPRKKYVHIKY